MDSARRNILDAQNIAHISPVGASSMAYDAIQQIAIALGTHDGFEAKTKNHHKEMLEFVENKHGYEIGFELFEKCDKSRRDRNKSKYKKRIELTPNQAKCSVKISEEFYDKVKKIIY